MPSSSVLFVLFLTFSTVSINGYVVQSEDHHYKRNFPYLNVKNSLLANNRFPKDPSSSDEQRFPIGNGKSELITDKERKLDSVCQECKTIVAEIAETLQDEKALERYKRAIKLVCLMTVRKAGECDAMVQGLDVVLENLKEALKDPDRACSVLHLCNSYELNLITRMLLSALKVLNFEMKSTLKNDVNAVDILCDECLFTANELATILGDPDYQKSLKDILKKLCGVIPQIQEQCETAIESYAPAIFEDILDYLANPKPFCQKAGFCRNGLGSYPLTPLLPAKDYSFPTEEDEKYMLAKEMRGDDDPCPFNNLKVNGVPAICPVCLHMVNETIHQLVKSEYIDNLKNMVSNLCEELPSDWTRSCQDFVDVYFKPSIITMLKEVQPQQACTLMHLCTYSDALTFLQMDHQDQKQTVCNACNMSVEFTKTKLTSHEFQKQAKENYYTICESMSPRLAQKCFEFADFTLSNLKVQAIEINRVPHLCAQYGMCKFP